MATGGAGSGGEDSLGGPGNLLRSPNAKFSDTEGSDELAATLHDIVDSARRAYPTFSLPTDMFVAYLLDRLPPDATRLLAIRQMYTSDLYLACGCAHGDLRAFEAFDERCLSRLDRLLVKMGIAADVSADVKQDIRTRVLVGKHGRAEIANFSGRGDLRGWVRVMAVRQALQRQYRARREMPVEDDEILQRIEAPGNLALDHAKGLYRQEFKRAFEGALRALPDRQRTLLRQHYVDGLTIDELGNLYRVHRSTAARLLVSARLLVLEATRTRMMSQLDVQSHDLDSIMRMIHSQIDINLDNLRRARKR